MRKNSFETIVLGVFLTLGLIAALVAASDRYRVEMRNRRVELTLDYPELRALAAMNNQPLTALLSKFRQLGVSGLAINEDTVASLEQAGAIQVRWTPGGVHINVLDRSGVTAKRLRTAITDHDISILPASAANSPDYIIISAPGERPYSIQLDYGDFRQMGIGLSPTALAVAHSSGLTPVARISNFSGVNEVAINRTLGQLENEGVRTVIFIGDEVLGFNGLEATDTADLLRKHDINFGDIEFGKQKGAETLAIALHGKLVRVHSITAAEMGTMSEQAAIERFTLAARERNIRLCYIRLLTDAGHQAIAKDEQYIAKIAQSISHHGQMSFGLARPFQKTNVPPPPIRVDRLGRSSRLRFAAAAFMGHADRRCLCLAGGDGIAAWRNRNRNGRNRSQTRRAGRRFDFSDAGMRPNRSLRLNADCDHEPLECGASGGYGISSSLIGHSGRDRDGCRVAGHPAVHGEGQSVYGD